MTDLPKLSREQLVMVRLAAADHEAQTDDIMKRTRQLGGLCFTPAEIAAMLELTPEQAAQLHDQDSELCKAMIRGYLEKQERIRRAVAVAAESGDPKALELFATYDTGAVLELLDEDPAVPKRRKKCPRKKAPRSQDR